MLLGIEHRMGHPHFFQHGRDFFGNINADGPHQHGLTFFVQLLDLPDDGAIFGLGIFIDHIGVILADHVVVSGNHHHVEIVDLLELRRLGVRGAGHAAELFIHPEVVLEGDRGQGLILPLHLDPLLGLQGLMQPIAETAALHGPAGELVHDHHLIVAHQIVHVPLEEHIGLQGLVQMMQPLDIPGVIEVIHPDKLFAQGHPFLGKRDRPGLLIQGVMFVNLEIRDDPVRPLVELGGHLGRAGDDQRGAGLVDQDGVHLVDNGVMELALTEILEVELHVVAQIIKAEFVVGSVGNIGAIGLLPGRVIHLMQDGADGKPEKAVELAHPFGITPGQVIVDRDHMHAAPGEGVEIYRQGGGQGFALAGFHLGDLALMEDDAADELHIKMPHAQNPPSRFPADGKGLGQQAVQGDSGGEPLLKEHGLRHQGSVIELLDLRLQLVDRRHQRLNGLENPFVFGAKNLFQNRSKHISTPEGQRRRHAVRHSPARSVFFWNIFHLSQIRASSLQSGNFGHWIQSLHTLWGSSFLSIGLNPSRSKKTG